MKLNVMLNCKSSRCYMFVVIMVPLLWPEVMMMMSKNSLIIICRNNQNCPLCMIVQDIITYCIIDIFVFCTCWEECKKKKICRETCQSWENAVLVSQSHIIIFLSLHLYFYNLRHLFFDKLKWTEIHCLKIKRTLSYDR